MGLQAGIVALLMMYLMNDEFTVDDRLVFPTLGIDMASRVDADNVGSTSPREIAQHRKINKGLAMELLTGLLLARLDSASAVHCNCDTRHGLPHAVAGGGMTDVEAIYEASGATPRFRVIAAVSAKSDVTRTFYLKQLQQALRHGRQIAERTGVPVYALVLNGGARPLLWPKACIAWPARRTISTTEMSACVACGKAAFCAIFGTLDQSPKLWRERHRDPEGARWARTVFRC